MKAGIRYCFFGVTIAKYTGFYNKFGTLRIEGRSELCRTKIYFLQFLLLMSNMLTLI